MPDNDPPPPVERRVFVARLDATTRTAAFARDFCTQHRIAGPLVLRLSLVLEELFTNTVRHGYGGDCDRNVHVELGLVGDRLHLVYEDDAPEFDPVAAARQSATRLDDATLPPRVGGLGLPLTLGMTRGASYARVDGRNRIELEIAEPAASGPRRPST